MIPDSFIQELLARLDIVDVIERYLPLKKAGANFVACCPFHSEKSPSFSVSPSKQFYHCFGCGAHGSAISFVMEYAGLGFVDTVHELAGNLGMPVPQQRPDERLPQADAAPLTELMARAARYYKEQLKASTKAIEYLKARGLTGEIAARFGMGYAPDGWQNLAAIFSDYQRKTLVECGLVIEGEGGKRYDRFRDRIMFPILNQRGNVIGFGGRVIGAGEPKYLNSPETPLFEKGRELYGLTQARAAIREADSVIVVEGYMDVVALAQQNVENAVATLGTATTPEHIHKLTRLASRVVFCFDADTAGEKAAWRALEASLEKVADNKALAFLFLSSQHDPDTFVREFGPTRFREVVAQAGSAMDYLIQKFRTRKDLGTTEGQSRLLHDAKLLLERISAPRLRAQLADAVARLARMTPSSPREAEAMLGLAPIRRSNSPHAINSNATAIYSRKVRPAPSTIERKLLKILISHPLLATRLPSEVLEEGRDGTEALLALSNAVAEGGLTGEGYGVVVEYFRSTPHETLISEVLSELAENEFDEESIEEVFTDTVDRLREAGIRHEIDALNIKNKSAGLAPDEVRRLQQLLTLKKTARPATEA